MPNKRMQDFSVTSLAGFTLLELLVTVVIIGILASIALPQYEKAVIKARTAEAQVNLKALNDAQERYWLMYRSYTNTLKELDIRVKESKYYTYACIEKRTCFANPTDTGKYPTFEFHMQRGENANLLGKHWCIGANDYTKKICESMDKKDDTMDGSFFVIN